MINKLYSVFDAKAAYFGNPFHDMQDGSAVRNFAAAVNDGSNKNNMWHSHPEDFSLYYIGEFDTATGELIPSVPKSLVTAAALRVVNNGKTPDQLDLKLDS